MSFYERYQKAWDDQDVSAMLDLYHHDYVRVFHAKGIEQGLDELVLRDDLLQTPDAR